MGLEDYFVQKMGEGPPLLFFPGAGFGGLEGLNLAERYEEAFEIHLMDMPGLGRSKGFDRRIHTRELADWVKHYLDLKGFDKVSVMGHSMGGFISLEFAYHYPERVDKLILLDWGHKRLPLITSEFGLFSLLVPVVSGLERLFGARIHRQLYRLFDSDDEDQSDFEQEVKGFCERMKVRDSPYVREALLEQRDLSMDSGAIALLLCMSRARVPQMFHNLVVPTLLVYGTHEGYDEKEAARTKKAIKAIPKERTHLYTCPVQTRHYVHWAGEEPLNRMDHFLLEMAETE